MGHLSSRCTLAALHFTMLFSPIFGGFRQLFAHYLENDGHLDGTMYMFFAPLANLQRMNYNLDNRSSTHLLSALNSFSRCAIFALFGYISALILFFL